MTQYLRFVRPSKYATNMNNDSKPPSIIVILGFVDYHRKWATVAREVNFGSSVVSMIWGEQPAIETAIRAGIPVRNYVVHAYHFQCEIVFLGQHIEWV